MISFIISKVFPELWADEEGRICPSLLDYSTGLILNEAIVEKHVFGLVRVLNQPSLGVETIASCQGHYFSQRQLPYVYFRCPIPIATQLGEMLYHFSVLEGKTNFHWHLTPMFNADFEICFHLNLGNFVMKKSSLFHYLKYWRQPLQQDFLTLSNLCQELFDKTLEKQRA